MQQSTGRQIVMVGFLHAQNRTNLVSSWRHPGSRRDSTSSEYYREIARVLEAAKFHLGFFDDRLTMADRYGNDRAHAVQYGIRCIMEVVLGHWETWGDDTIFADRAAGLFAHPDNRRDGRCVRR
jgi:hypothetical protein